MTLRSTYHMVLRWLKRKIGIRSWTSFKANTKRKVNKRIYRKSYSTNDIIELMKSMGLKKGSNIFIHSSLDEFYNYSGTVDEFIDAILAEIGSDGTLAMPSFPLFKNNDDIFDIENTPTAAGMIAEVFRRYPDVQRSACTRHSVCAIGPLAGYLLDEHQYSETCWDEKSPYYKLSKINALIFVIGLGKHWLPTATHCADSILKDEIPYFSLLFQKKIITQIRLLDKSIYKREYYPVGDVYRYATYRHWGKYIYRYFEKSKYIKKKISNLTVNVYDAKYLIDRSIELGRKGIVIWLKPKPLKKYFAKNTG